MARWVGTDLAENDGGGVMKQTYTIDIVLSDAEIYFLRKLFGKNKNTGAARLVTIAVKRAVAEAAMQELARTGYAPIEEEYAQGGLRHLVRAQRARGAG